jgi:hypothetical protein
MLDRQGRTNVESSAMPILTLWIRALALLALSLIAGIALAQQPPAKAETETPALAALHAIDAYEASLETWVPYADQADFEEREKASGHQAKLERARRALEKISDLALRNDLNILLTDTQFIILAGTKLALDPSDKSFPTAVAQFHADRNLVATQITSGKRGLLRDAILERSHKK